MRNQSVFRDKRLLDALDYIDPRFIAEAAHRIKERPIGYVPSSDKGNRKVIVRQILKLVACLLILSAVIPVITYVIRNFADFTGWFTGDTSEESLPELTLPETPPPETTAEVTTGVETTAEETTAEETTAPPEIEYDGSRGLSYTTNGFFATLTGIGSCSDSEIVVASTYDGMPVKKIGASAFANCSGVVSITIPDTVSSISDGAFSGCSDLKTLVIGSELTIMPTDIISGCPGLERLEISQDNRYYSSAGNCLINKAYKTLIRAFATSEIPSDGSVETIESGAFNAVKGLTEIVISEGVKTVKEGAIVNCPDLKKITFSSTVESIEAGAVSTCPAIEALVVAEGSSSYLSSGNCIIDTKANRSIILGCKTSVIPTDINYLSRIGERAFEGCTGLTSIVLPENIASIGEYSFRGCTSLKDIDILETGRIYFYDGCFMGCTSIESFKVVRDFSYGDTYTHFYSSVFEGCTSLREIEFVGDMYFRGNNIFKDCVSLESIDYTNGNPYIGEGIFSGCVNLKSVTLNQTVEEIGANAFYGCRSLESISLSGKLRYIYGGAFEGCTSLKSVSFAGTTVEWRAVTKSEGWNLNAAFTSVSCSDGDAEVGNPNAVYDGSRGLEYVVNPDGKTASIVSTGSWKSNGEPMQIASSYDGKPVTVIPREIFSMRVYIKGYVLPDTVESIGYRAFAYNYKYVTELTLPASLKEIGEEAFAGCNVLEKLVFKGTVAEWNKVERGERWNIGCPFTKVVCSDGEVSITPYPDHDGTEGLTYYISYNQISREYYATFTGIGTCTENSITVASFYKGFPVKAVNSSALQDNTWVKNIVLRAPIEIINDYAFRGCTALESITLPETLTTIYDYAFYQCSSLRSISLPESLTYVRGSILSFCDSLESIYIPRDLTEAMSLSGCPALKTIKVHPDNPVYSDQGNCLINKETKTLIHVLNTSTIPSDGSVETIGEAAFCNYTLKKLVLPEGIRSFDMGAIVGVDTLESIHFPSTFIDKGDYFLSGCNNIEEITVASGNPKYYAKNNCLIERESGVLVIAGKKSTIPNDGSIKAIGSSAFSHNTYITEIVIPEGVTSIGSSAFWNCTNLKSVSLPESLKSIGSYAFNYCTSLKKLSIGDNVTSFGIEVFAVCSSLEEITLPKRVEQWGWGMFDGCKSLKSIALPIGMDYASISFANCTSLTDVILPNDVTEISNYAFHGCTSLKTLVIPESVIVIGDFAFMGCTSLERLILPESVTEIGMEAFYNCSSLVSINIPEGVTEISSQSFLGCSSLGSITLPKSVNKINYMAFKDCTALKDIIFEGTLAEWEAVSKGANWDSESGIVSVRCTDGSTADAQESPDYSDLAALPELYRKVLMNEIPFCDTSTGENIYLDDMQKLTVYSSDTVIRFSESEDVGYAVIDIDGDGNLELILTEYRPLETPSYLDAGEKLILKEYNGEVYGYRFKERILRDLRIDGTFRFGRGQPSVSYSTRSRIKFSTKGYNVTDLCSSKDSEYYIGTNKVTYEEYSEYLAEFEKDYVKWYKFERYPLEASAQN